VIIAVAGVGKAGININIADAPTIPTLNTTIRRYITIKKLVGLRSLTVVPDNTVFDRAGATSHSCPLVTYKRAATDSPTAFEKPATLEAYVVDYEVYNTPQKLGA